MDHWRGLGKEVDMGGKGRCSTIVFWENFCLLRACQDVIKSSKFEGETEAFPDGLKNAATVNPRNCLTRHIHRRRLCPNRKSEVLALPDRLAASAAYLGGGGCSDEMLGIS